MDILTERASQHYKNSLEKFQELDRQLMEDPRLAVLNKNKAHWGWDNNWLLGGEGGAPPVPPSDWPMTTWNSYKNNIGKDADSEYEKGQQTQTDKRRRDAIMKSTLSLSGIAVVVVLVNWMQIKEKMTDYAYWREFSYVVFEKKDWFIGVSAIAVW